MDSNNFQRVFITSPQSSETDWNRDGKLDSLSLKLEMPLRADENVYSVDLFLFFDVKLHVSCVICRMGYRESDFLKDFTDFLKDPISTMTQYV